MLVIVTGISCDRSRRKDSSVDKEVVDEMTIDWKPRTIEVEKWRFSFILSVESELRLSKQGKGKLTEREPRMKLMYVCPCIKLVTHVQALCNVHKSFGPQVRPRCTVS